jgi:hypothetical protein
MNRHRGETGLLAARGLGWEHLLQGAGTQHSPWRLACIGIISFPLRSTLSVSP